MKRRSFLKSAAIAPLAFHIACKSNSASNFHFIPQTEKTFAFLEVEGSYREIGYRIGKTFRSNIRIILNRLPGMLDKIKSIAESELGKKFSDELYFSLKNHFPHLIDELQGTADGTGIHFNLMWYLSIRSELFAFAKENPSCSYEPPGCSTVYYNNNSNNWLFHNEDGDKAYRNEMFVLKAKPPSGVSYYSFVYPTYITGVGPTLNSEGIIQSSNYIGTNKAETGIPRYFIGRAILESRSLEEALQIAEMNPRAFPWHHNLASVSSGEYISVETLPRNYKFSDNEKGYTLIRKNFKDMPYIHTNHTTAEETKDYIHQDVDYAKTSETRYNVLQELKNNAEYPIEKPETILNWLSSRKDAPDCPCKIGDNKTSSETLGTAFFDLKRGVYRLYKGYPSASVPNKKFAEFKF